MSAHRQAKRNDATETNSLVLFLAINSSVPGIDRGVVDAGEGRLRAGRQPHNGQENIAGKPYAIQDKWDLCLSEI